MEQRDMQGRVPMRSREEQVVVLDYLQNGYPFERSNTFKKQAIAQVIGKDRFTLLEVVPKPDIFLQPYEELYIGEGKRDKVHHVNGKIPLSKLTATAHGELKFIVEKLVSDNEKKFVEFFNKAQPLSTRMHQLELLPGLGKKHMWMVIEERDVKPFESFADVKARVKLLPDPKGLIIKRVLKELEGEEKYQLFVD